MTKPKILFVGQFAPPVHGVSVMNEYVAKSNILKVNYKFVKVNLTTATSIDNIGKKGLGKYFRFIGIAFKTIYFLSTRKFYCAYITLTPVGFGFTKDSFIVNLVRMFGVPLVLHLHGKGIDKAINDGAPKLKKKYTKVFKDTHVICLSEKLRQDIQQINSYSKVYIVNNGIPGRPKEENKMIIRDDIKILMLSNLIRSKGGLDLLAAIKILADKGIDNFKVTFAGAWGESDFKQEFNNYIKQYLLEKYVTLEGPVYSLQKTELLRNANIFILPTYYPNECFPLTILEAMNCKLAVIASSEGAIPEIIDHGKNGIIIEAQDPKILATAIEKLLQDPELAVTMGLNAVDKFNQHFRLEIFERNLLNVFNKINS